jgi:hypothetical protein
MPHGLELGDHRFCPAGLDEKNTITDPTSQVGRKLFARQDLFGQDRVFRLDERHSAVEFGRNASINRSRATRAGMHDV